jgi:hypothetical protein
MPVVARQTLATTSDKRAEALTYAWVFLLKVAFDD